MVLGVYFADNKRQFILANGIAFAGISTGQMVLPPLLEYLFSQYGWRGGILVLSAIKFNLVAAAALYRPIGRDQGSSIKGSNDCSSNENTNHYLNCNETAEQDDREIRRKHSGEETKSVGVLTLCRNKHYMLFLFTLTIIAMVFLSGNVFIVPRATNAGIEPFQATILVTISGVCGGVSSVGHSVLINRKFISAHALFLASCIVCAVTLFVNPLSDHFVFLLFNVVLFSISIGIVSPLITNPIPRLIVEQKTPSLVDPALGFVMLTSSLAQGAGMTLAGKFEFSTHPRSRVVHHALIHAFYQENSVCRHKFRLTYNVSV